jgi:ATP-dependent helicase HrpB
VDLAGLALELAVWGADAGALPFLDQPPAAALAEGRALLATLGALDGAGRPTPAGRAMAGLPVHPRLAHLLRAAPVPLATVLAALVEEGDVMAGAPTADIADRVRLVMQPGGDRRARTVARRARELARRLDVAAGPEPDPTDLDAIGPLLALAFPDRLAQARGGGRYRLRSGAGASLSDTDPLRSAPFLVVVETSRATGGTGDDRIRLAAPLDRVEVEAVAGPDAEERTALIWDPDRDDLRVRRRRHADALVLDERDGPAEAGPATTAALVARVRDRGLALVPGAEAARALRHRIDFAHRLDPGTWPATDDASLLAALDAWLAPALTAAGATRRADLDRLDVAAALWAWIGPHRRAGLDRSAPATVTVAGGRTLPVDYSGDRPAVRARAQDLYGTTAHPTVGGVPVVVHLLSPAGRPIQVTADLPGFWAGSWSAVRREMAGRYPKHDWPADPATATARPRRSRRPGRA